MAVSIFLMIFTGYVCFYMYTVCWQGHQVVPHTQGTINIKDVVTRLEQGTAHPTNRRLLGTTRENIHTACSRIQAVLVLVRIQRYHPVLPVRVQQTPSRYCQREFNEYHPRLTVEDSTKAVQVLLVKIQQRLSKYCQWRFLESCPSITSEFSAKTVQVLPVKAQRKLSRYYQCGFNKSSPGITSEYSTKPVKVLTGGVSVEREFALCLEENEMKFAGFWKIFYVKTLGRGINEWDNDFGMVKK